MDEHGIVPEALAAAARHSGARVLVVSPNLHNPTAILMPAERRAAIVAVARELDLLLVEDDVYGPLVADRPDALATLAPERTLYLSSLSKFLAPGLRLGFVLRAGQLGARGYRGAARAVARPCAHRGRAVRPRLSVGRGGGGAAPAAAGDGRTPASRARAAGRPRHGDAADLAAYLAEPAGALDQRRGRPGAGPDRRAGDARRSGSSSAGARHHARCGSRSRRRRPAPTCAARWSGSPACWRPMPGRPRPAASSSARSPAGSRPA